MRNTPKITKKILKLIPLKTKIEMLHEYIGHDVQMTLKFFKPGEGLAQVEQDTRYIPGVAGCLILEDGMSGLENLGLNEKGIDHFLLIIFKRAEAISRMAKKYSKGPGKKTILSHLALNNPKVLRESFQVLNDQD